MRRRYHQAIDGEPIAIPMLNQVWFGIKLMCCDCGLVHKHVYRVRGKKMELTTWRDVRATSATRRQRKRKNPAASR